MEYPHQHRKSLLTLVGLLAMLAPAAKWETVDRVVAEVGDQVITLTDLHWQIDLHDYRKPATEEEQHSLYREVLDQLINQSLIVRDISKTPFIDVSETELNSFVESYERRFASKEDLQRRLREMGMQEQDLRQILRRQLAVNKFIQLRFEPFVIILPDDIQQYYHDEYVPELEKKGLPVPDLSVVRETIRQILTVRRTTDQLEEWLQTARSRTQIRESLFPVPLDMPNLPRQFRDQIHTIPDPFSKKPSSNPR